MNTFPRGIKLSKTQRVVKGHIFVELHATEAELMTIPQVIPA